MIFRLEPLEQKNTLLKWLSLVCVAAFPVTFLSIRHGVHVSLYGLLILGIIQRLTVNKSFLKTHKAPNELIIVSIALASIFIASVISHGLRHDLNWSALDGPSRLLIAGLILILLPPLKPSPLKLLEWAIPAGLMVLMVVLIANPDSRIGWNVAGIQRMASSFVDPNTLGSQSMILGLLCFFMIRPLSEETNAQRLIKIMGGGAGIYISIATASRGGWLALPFIISTWFIIQLSQVKQLPESQQRKYYWRYSLVLLMSVLALLIIYSSSNIFSSRVQSAYREITHWLEGTDLNGAAGIRLSMWKIAFSLIQEYPLLGIGERSIASLLVNHPLNTTAYEQAINDLIAAGPHSDILSKTLSNGIFGLVAYICTLALPLIIFIKHLRARHRDIQLAAQIGVYYIAGIFVCGLSNEMLSLKYLCSFYGLMIVCLVNQTAQDQPHL